MSNGNVFLLKTGAGVKTPQITDPGPGSELQFTWNLEISAAAVDEGEDAPDITIRRNLNGNPHQDCTIWIEPTTPPSGVSANSNDFTAGFRTVTGGSNQLIPRATAAGIECINGPGTSVSLTWRAASQNEFTFNRNTIVRDGNEGDRIACYRLFNPTLGTPSDQQVQHTIVDTYVEPSGLTLNAITRPYTLCRRTAVVGETVFEVSASAGTISSITLADDQGGRFAVGTPAAGVWPIITTSIPCDFEKFTFPWPNGSTRGLSNYRPTLHIEGSGTIIDELVRVFPIFVKMNSATIGNLTAGKFGYSQYNFVFAGWGFDADIANKTFIVNESAVTGSILKNTLTGAAVLNNRCSNATYIGHWRTLLRNGQALEKTEGRNIKMKDMSVKGGKHMLQYGVSGANVDCISIGDANTLAKQVTDIWVEYCSFQFSIDECAQIYSATIRGPFVRRFMYMFCLFADACWSGHADGPHAFGPLVQHYTMEAYFIFCVFVGFVQRSPLFGSCNGEVVQNCVMFYNATQLSHGGICQVGASHADPSWQDGPAKEVLDISAIWRGNLLHAYGTTTCRKANAIWLQKVFGLNYINPYFGQSPYENHFIGHGPEPAHFESDPLSMANVHLFQLSNPTTSIIDYDGFKLDPVTNPDQYGLMPTATEQNREDLYEFVLNRVGPHERVGNVHTGAIIPGPTHMQYVDYHAVNLARQGIFQINDYTPSPVTYLDNRWGVDWNGVGGSVGKSMVDVGEAWTV